MTLAELLDLGLEIPFDTILDFEAFEVREPILASNFFREIERQASTGRRFKSAIHGALAAWYAHDNQWEATWEPDDPYVDDEGGTWETEQVLVRDSEGHVRGSLGSVTFSADPKEARRYRKEVEMDTVREAVEQELLDAEYRRIVLGEGVLDDPR